MLSQRTSLIPKKAAKRGRGGKPISSSPSEFWQDVRFFFCYHLGNFGKTSCSHLTYLQKLYFLCLDVKVSHGIAIINYNEHDRIVQWRIFFFQRVFGILHQQKVFCCLPKTRSYLAFPIGRSMLSFIDKTMKRIPSSSFSTICVLVSSTAFLLTLFRVDISVFPQIWMAKLQECSLTKEDEQQPLSGDLSVKQCYNFSFRIPIHNHSIKNCGMCHACVTEIFCFWRNGE